MKFHIPELDFDLLGDKFEYDHKEREMASKEMISLFMEDEINRESGRVAPDTTGADKFFLDEFITEDMEYEFWAIARDFLKHNFSRAREFDSLAYYDNDSPNMSDPNRSMQLTVLNLMYNAAKAGDPYSVELIKYLYKTFHKKEYKQLKRFNKISVNEIFSLSEIPNIGCSYEKIGRILGMCQIYKIELEESCSILYLLLNRRHTEFDADDEKERDYIRFKKGLFQECVAQVDEWLGTVNADKREKVAAAYDKCGKYWHIEEFVGNCFRYYGFPEDYNYLSANYDVPLAERMARTLAILKTTFPKEEFTKDEVLIYTHIYTLVENVIDVSNNMHDNFTQMLGVEDDTAVVDGQPMYFDPKNISYSERKAPEKTESKPINISPVSMGEAKEADYLKEIAELRNRLSKKESEAKHLRGQYDALRREVAEEREKLVKYQDDREELIALREHVYRLSEDDLDDERTSIDEAKKKIEHHTIVIIGGHTNWVNKLKEQFSGWRYIGNESYRTADGRMLEGAERVYFFTDHISHVLYGKYVSLVRAKDIPFGYIHSTNIDATIRAVYRDFMK